MMKSILFTAFTFASVFAFGFMQDEVPVDTLWKKAGTLNFNLQQVGFSNWANGGQPSLSYGSVLNYSANRADENSTWNNSFQAAFGFLKQNETAAKKNTDLLIIKSEFGKIIGPNVQLAIGTDIRSQFAKGYSYAEDPNTGDEVSTLVSSFFSPGYIQTSVGISYKNGDKFTLGASPLANKLTFVLDDELSNQGLYGVDPGEKVRSQIGASLNAGYSSALVENVTLKTNLMLFGDYKTLAYWDVNYDLYLDFKVNDFITTNFLIQAIYDHDIKGNSEDEEITGPALQIRSVLNIGLTIKL